MSGQRLVYACGQLAVDLDRRELLVHGAPALVGDRALEVLAILVQAAGELVTKDELMRRVWPGAFVEENTLEVHVSALRKALGSDRRLLKTSYARGYRLLGEWTPLQRATRADTAQALSTPGVTRPFQSNLPIMSSALIGRDNAVQTVRDLLSANRIVTLTGVGGIGKTRLALEVARGWGATLEGDVWLVELAALLSPDLVPSAVSRILGLRLSGDESSADAVARAIGDERALLVLDNCEHVVDAAARLTDAIMRLCPRTTVLATSREMLRVDGEHVYHVLPLDVPLPGADDLTELLKCSAAALFVAQTRAQDSSFLPKKEDFSAIGAICRQLDGIPLAIEFAAARAATIGVRRVASALADRFALLTVGRRAALPRHQTLRAALDWSYDLLPENESVTLRCLAVFAGDFSLDAALAVAADPPGQSIVDCIANLVSKSLVLADLRHGTPYYRLLETVRLYALEKLSVGSQQAGAARRHAEYYQRLSAQAEAESKTLAEAEWLATYGRHLDNWRVALDWSFSPDGDAGIGFALTVGALPIWFKLSLMNECCRRVEQALAVTSVKAEPEILMRLSAGLAAALFYTRKGAAPDVAEAWTKVLSLADSLANTEHRLWARWGLWNYQLNHGAFQEALVSAQRFCDLANEPADQATGDRMVGVSLHYLGQQAPARQHLERSLARHVDKVARSMIRHQYDHKLAARSYLPRILWVQGFPDQAVSAAESVVEDAVAAGHVLASSLALVQAGCPVALLTGNLVAAGKHIAALLDKATTHGLGFWRAEGQCFKGILLVMQGDAAGGLQLFDPAIQELVAFNASMNITGYLAAMGAALADAVDMQRCGTIVDQALTRADRDEDRWCIPELLRLRGECLLHEGTSDAQAKAEAQFRQALDVAIQQEAQSWSLRSATDLAQLMRDQGRFAEARSVLSPVYGWFVEGFQTTDLRRARSLLSALD